MERTQSTALYNKAQELFPGGVNSPVRAFRSVNGTPLFIERGKGAYIWDADGQQYIDFCGSWGPLILGHAPDEVVAAVGKALQNGTSFGAPTRLENELAETILDNHRFIEKIRFVNSGTEAVMSAVRLARGYSGKNKIIKFEGCYHGHVDALLVKAGSGLVTFGNASSAGIPKNTVEDTIVVPLNDRDALTKAIEEFASDIACVIIEPIPANNGLLIQGKEFLQFLRDITKKHDILLIFDEVISGFRIGFEGAAGLYDIQPDIMTFGKIIGGGMPVGAYGSSKEIMSQISPDGPVYQAGTLSGNPVAMAAGLAQLKTCLKPDFYKNLEEKCRDFCERINAFTSEKAYPVRMIYQGSIFWVSFSETDDIRSAAKIDANNMDWFSRLHNTLLEKSIYIGPSGYEVGFISAAHTSEILRQAEKAFCEAVDLVFNETKGTP